MLGLIPVEVAGTECFCKGARFKKRERQAV
jgi:hypothetical protein